jgi:hypothetical protein
VWQFTAAIKKMLRQTMELSSPFFFSLSRPGKSGAAAARNSHFSRSLAHASKLPFAGEVVEGIGKGLGETEQASSGLSLVAHN